MTEDVKTVKYADPRILMHMQFTLHLIAFIHVISEVMPTEITKVNLLILCRVCPMRELSKRRDLETRTKQ
jgi:hypothetical protein